MHTVATLVTMQHLAPLKRYSGRMPLRVDCTDDGSSDKRRTPDDRESFVPRTDAMLQRRCCCACWWWWCWWCWCSWRGSLAASRRRSNSFNHLECKGNYTSATANNMKLEHWPLMGALLHLVQGW